MARFSVTSIVMVTSTSAGRMPVHRMPIENVSISIGIFPVREIFIAGRGKTAGSDVTIFMLYGSYVAKKISNEMKRRNKKIELSFVLL